MSCHLLPAESTDDEICVDPAEDVRDNKAKFPEPPGSNSVFQVGLIQGPTVTQKKGGRRAQYCDTASCVKQKLPRSIPNATSLVAIA